jgi:hypothetical protein
MPETACWPLPAQHQRRQKRRRTGDGQLKPYPEKGSLAARRFVAHTNATEAVTTGQAEMPSRCRSQPAQRYYITM